MHLKFEVAQASNERREGADDVHQSDHYLTGKTGLGHALRTRLPTSTPVVKGKHKSPAVSHHCSRLPFSWPEAQVF